jgi:hypothetical protein
MAKKLPEQVAELRELVIAYFRQETVDPIKALGRFLAYGVGGSLLLGVGVIFLTVGGVRALQVETGDTFTGNWSWVPYAIMAGVLAIGVSLLVLTMRAEKGEA